MKATAKCFVSLMPLKSNLTLANFPPLPVPEANPPELPEPKPETT